MYKVKINYSCVSNNFFIEMTFSEERDALSTYYKLCSEYKQGHDIEIYSYDPTKFVFIPHDNVVDIKIEENPDVDK